VVAINGTDLAVWQETIGRFSQKSADFSQFFNDFRRFLEQFARFPPDFLDFSPIFSKDFRNDFSCNNFPR
jgi:hypothetical protein